MWKEDGFLSNVWFVLRFKFLLEELKNGGDFWGFKG